MDNKKIGIIALVIAFLALVSTVGITTLTGNFANTTGEKTITVGAGKNFTTIQEAYDSIAPVILGNQTILIDAGTYNENLNIGGKSTNGAYYILLQGENITDVSTTTTSGTAGDGITQATVTVSGSSWNINSFRGRWLKFTSGSLSGKIRLIETNTADTITLIGSFFNNAPQNGDAFIIYHNGVNISGNINVKPTSVELKLRNLNINGFGGAQFKTELIEVNHTISNYLSNTYELVAYQGYRNYYNYSVVGINGLWFSDSTVRIFQSYLKGWGDTGYGYYWGILAQSGGQEIIYCGTLIDNISWGIWSSVGGVVNTNMDTGGDPQADFPTNIIIKNTAIGIIANSGGHVAENSAVTYLSNGINNQADAASYSWIGT